MHGTPCSKLEGWLCQPIPFWKPGQRPIRFVRAVIFLLIWAVGGAPSLPSGHAEWYGGGYGGISLPGTLTDATVSRNFGRYGTTASAKTTDIEMQNNPVLGVKLGHFSEEHKWLGLETEVFTFSPNMTQQPLIVAQPGKTAIGTIVPGAHLRVTTWAFNVITRDTAPGRFVPYGGIGLGMFYVTSNDFSGKPQVTPGLNLLGGARYFLGDNLALFGEFKYQLAEWKFGGFKGAYTGQMFIGGVSYHFDLSQASLSKATAPPN